MNDPFGETHCEANAKLLVLGSDVGALVRAMVHPNLEGAEGGDFAMDFTIFGDPAPEKTLLLISGTHGQEGFTGSAKGL